MDSFALAPGTQLGKLNVFEPAQELSCKTAPIGPQSHQTVKPKMQNGQTPANAKSPPKERPMGKWGDAFGIMREMVYGKRRYLDLFEQTTLAFIFGRTTYYGKEWEFIPLRHFMSGVWSRTSGCISPRIRISETKLLEAIKGLEAKTIIEVERRPAPRRGWERPAPRE